MIDLSADFTHMTPELVDHISSLGVDIEYVRRDVRVRGTVIRLNGTDTMVTDGIGADHPTAGDVASEFATRVVKAGTR